MREFNETRKINRSHKQRKLSLILTVIFFLSVIPLTYHVGIANNGGIDHPLSQKAIDTTNEEYNYNIVQIKGEYRLHLDDPTILDSWIVHIPQIRSDQTPISLVDIYTTPINILSGWQITQEPFSGNNTVLEVFFNDVEAGEYRLHWTVNLLIRENLRLNFPSNLPLAVPEDLPVETLTWLESSPFIQANNTEIIAKSVELAANSTDAIEITRNILDYSTNTIEYGINLTDYSQDALSSLRREQAVCTGRTNLCTALFRALGIPARVHLIYPTHFVVECYLEPYGWVKVEPGMEAFCHEVFAPSTVSPNFQSYITAFVPEPSEENNETVLLGFAPFSGVNAFYSPANETNWVEIQTSTDWQGVGKVGSFKSSEINSTLATNVSTDLFHLSQLFWELRTNLINQLGSENFIATYPLTLDNESSALISLLQYRDVEAYMEFLTVAALKLINTDDSFVLDEPGDEEDPNPSIPFALGPSLIFSGMAIVAIIEIKTGKIPSENGKNLISKHS